VIAFGDTHRAQAAALARAVSEKEGATKEWTAASSALEGIRRSIDDLSAAISRAEGDEKRATATLQAAGTASEEVAKLREQITRFVGARERVTALDRDLREQEPLVRMAARDADSEMAAADIRIRQAATLIEVAERQAALLGGVPCGGKMFATVDCGKCNFLADAAKGAASLPSLRASMESARGLRAAGEAKQLAAKDRNVALERIRTQLAQAQREAGELARLETDIARREAQAAEAQRATAAKEEAILRRSCLEKEKNAKASDMERATSELATIVERGREAAKQVDRLKGADQRLAELEAAIARLPLLIQQRDAALARAEAANQVRDSIVIPPPPERQRDICTTALRVSASAQARLTVAREEVRRIEEELGLAGGGLALLGILEERSISLAARRERVARRRAGFILVEAAMGRDGIQALEIDAAGPEVSILCNQLLEACFGPRFSVALRTIQEATKTRKQQEVFDLSVHDGLRGRSGPADGLSGGEQVLVNEALRLALAIFNARRHGDLFECLFRDEADTGLSENLRALFPPMLRRGLDLGGFRNLYFITHHREAWEQADAIIRIEDGRATVEIR